MLVWVDGMSKYVPSKFWTTIPPSLSVTTFFTICVPVVSGEGQSPNTVHHDEPPTTRIPVEKVLLPVYWLFDTWLRITEALAPKPTSIPFCAIRGVGPTPVTVLPLIDAAA